MESHWLVAGQKFFQFFSCISKRNTILFTKWKGNNFSFKIILECWHRQHLFFIMTRWALRKKVFVNFTSCISLSPVQYTVYIKALSNLYFHIKQLYEFHEIVLKLPPNYNESSLYWLNTRIKRNRVQGAWKSCACVYENEWWQALLSKAFIHWRVTLAGRYPLLKCLLPVHFYFQYMRIWLQFH